MKKLLPIILLLALLPAVVAAQGEKTKVKAIDLTIDVPSAGMTKAEGAKMALTAANTVYGDLLSKGAVSLKKIIWYGEFDNTDKRNPKFQAGYTYEATIQLAFKTDGAYVTNYIMKNGDYYLDDALFKATVNGVAARTMVSTPYFPTLKVNLPVAGDKGAVASTTVKRGAADKAAYRSTTKPYGTAEADALWVGRQAYDVIVVDRNNKPSLSANGEEYPCQKSLFITKLIVDLGGDDPADKNYVNGIAGDLGNFMSGPFNLKEVWLSDKVDIPAFVKSLHETMIDPLYPATRYYWNYSILFFTAEATLCIPESAVPAVQAIVSKDPTQPVYTIKAYSGDVYAAQKAGLSAAKEWCHQHKYTKRLMTADRAFHYETCQTDLQWYYSCAICGKCEYNDKHTFSHVAGLTSDGPVGPRAHSYYADLATDEAYVGVNSAGEHVYWQSCIWCGHSYSYHQKHLTQKDFAGHDGTFEQFKKSSADALAMRESQALLRTRAMPQMFTLSQKAAAKTSDGAKSGVNHALSNNLADTELLGADYTAPVTRLQLASIAVRLAEELTGKSVAPASAFSDIRNDYAGKAAAMGLTADIAGDTFSPDAAVSRQEMAAFIYRALRYVEKNSEYAYTDYTSKLSSYSDNGQIAAWAQEPMAFMDALGLIEGTSATMLGPEETCTVEQALVVAERSIYAHQIGWYQVLAHGEKTESGWTGFISRGSANDKYHSLPGDDGITPMSLGLSDRVWVIGRRLGVSAGWMPTVDSYTHQTFYLKAEWFRPVRGKGAKPQAVADAPAPESSKPVPAEQDGKGKAKSAVKDAVKKGLGGLFKNLK